jgi:proteasome-associated ATPase
VTADDLVAGVREEFKENEDLPNTSNPDDWAKIAGRKGERIVYVKVLTNEVRKDGKQPKPVEKIATGQYL